MADIPAIFTTKKNSILQSLSTPDEEYSDMSPKGSVDLGIRQLIDDINRVDGLVTTSSCAGRISVFLEGVKAEESDEMVPNQNSQTAVPGGKGRGGRWLFVSHEAVSKSDALSLETKSVTKLFGMSNHAACPTNLASGSIRFVKLQFEPMILHVMAATLHHAQPVLSSAINAGFRESGLQSLKNLVDPNAFPMIAIRSSGLALSSIVGYALTDNGVTSIKCMVGEGYLRTLLDLANGRFVENRKRTDRFRLQLLQDGNKSFRHWEDGKARAERMKVLGLEQQNKQTRKPTKDQLCHNDGDDVMDDLGLDLP